MKTPLLALLITLSLWGSEFPSPYNSEPDTSGPMPAAEAVANLILPPGFRATVFAAEPDVQNPIAMAWDSRGRLWVAENYTYAEAGKNFDLNLRDRILIFEDKDGDGRFDTRKVFTDNLQMLTSVEVGHGGVWAMCPPRLLFIPDRNGDDLPDNPPEVVLDGFAVEPESHHTFANGLRFGPDGWLYGRCGASSPAEMGVPGTPPDQRVPLRGTIWRFHPKLKIVEALSCGTTNPWGHDWDEHGELFFINTVNGHLWHEFAGAHFVRPHTIDPNPRAYALIDQHADHWHFDTGKPWQDSRDGKANSFGGGHAHVGMMIYQGDNWPAEYRGHLFTLNFHGRRANQDILERRGSGYVGKHGPDVFIAGDPWFRGMDLSYGPDGGVFVLDWSDTGECHDSTGVHRTSGRVFKVFYGDPKPRQIGDLAQLSSSELVNLQMNANEWFTRQARLELEARAETGRGLDRAEGQLRQLFENHPDAVVKLRALWSLYTLGLVDEPFLRAQLQHPNEHVRTWAVRLLTDTWPLDTVMSQRPAARSEADQPAILAEFVRLAKTDTSGLVRLALASTLQRLPISHRGDLAAALMARKEDAEDHNLPLLIWYGLIPVANSDPGALATMAAQCEMPLTRRFIARRLAEDIERNPAPLNRLFGLSTAGSEECQTDIVNGTADGLAGWRKATKPAAWDPLAARLGSSTNPALRDCVRDLSVVFGDGRALDAVIKVALDPHANLNSRKAALQTLINNRAPELRSVCEAVLDTQFLNSVAASGLVTFDDPSVSAELVRAYRRFHPSERGQLISALSSRPVFALALLEAVAGGKIARADISAFHARQIRGLNNPKLNDRLAEVWGEFRDSPADKQQSIAKWKAQLTGAELARADKSLGRVLFNTACASCHTLFGDGGKVGPDLTGGGRANLDFLLQNIVDPSAVVPADFRMSIVDLKDGRVLNAIITSKTERTMTLKTMTESLTVERSEIASITESALSLMPEGLLEGMTPPQARDLIAYLMSASQVPLPSPSGATSNSN